MASAVGELLADGFGRIRDEVEAVLDAIPPAALAWRADRDANTVAWLVWHLTRVQDDHVAEAFAVAQLWHEQGWVDRFGLPFDRDATGYGQDRDAVARLGDVSADLLVGYHRAVAARTIALVGDLGAEQLQRVVDERWDPPVTLAVRLVSVIADDLQHTGQAAFVRGLAERAG